MSRVLSSPIELPCGLTLPNRLVKAAMGEQMANKAADPSDEHMVVYDKWASGGWGAIITGNVDVTSVYRGTNDNVSINPTLPQSSKDAWTRWALATQQNNTPALIQLVHAGRQSAIGCGTKGLFDKSIAPSAVPMQMGRGWLAAVFNALIFGTPRAMTLKEIDEAISQFATAAKFAHDSGFKGVELHGAHGYLIETFLSARSNIRTDAYGGTAAKRAKFLVEVIRAIRKVVPASFCVGIKLNSADVGGLDNMEEVLEQIGIISKEQIDFIEISGGSYENPRFCKGDNTSARTAAREAFFLDFARTVRTRFPDVVLLVTGGFRTRKGMQTALESKACDLIGLARPAAVSPKFAKEVILNKNVKDSEAGIEIYWVQGPWLAKKLAKIIPMIGSGIDSVYFVGQIRAIATGKTPQLPPKPQ